MFKIKTRIMLTRHRLTNHKPFFVTHWNVFFLGRRILGHICDSTTENDQPTSSVRIVSINETIPSHRKKTSY